MTNALFFRRKGYGAVACLEISKLLNNSISIYRSDGKLYDFNTNSYVSSPLPSGITHLIRWGCTSQLPASLNIPDEINDAVAISRIANKAMFRMRLSDEGLAPKSWLDVNTFVNEPDYISLFPLIVRPARHFGGQNLWKVDNISQLMERCSSLGLGNYYFSQYINKIREYRVCTFDKRVSWIAEKIPNDPSAIAWNHAGGGSIYQNIPFGSWSSSMIRLALKTSELGGIDFAGVDIIEDQEGRFYVLEANSAPSLSPYRQKCLAKCFNYRINVGRNAQIHNLDSTHLSYVDFAHPGLFVEL